MRVADIDIGYENISDLFGDGQTHFAVWFGRMLDANGWSYPKFVALCTACTGGKAKMHASQANSLKFGRLKSPGPHSFMAMVYTFRCIDAYQKGEMDELMPDLSSFHKSIEKAVILRDDDGNPASIGYMFEVFCGWRKPPSKAIVRTFTDEQATEVSKAAGKLVRRLVSATGLDLIDDMDRMKAKFSKDEKAQEVFEKVVIGQGHWTNEDLDHNITCLSHLLQKMFKHDLNSEELMNDLLKSI